MAVAWHFEEPDVPLRAIVLSFGALAVPVVGRALAPAGLEEPMVMSWLLALVPAFLLAYYRGWRGVTIALLIGMIVLVAAESVLALLGREVRSPLLLTSVVGFYNAIALGLGFFSERLHRQRAAAEQLALTDELTELPNRRKARMVLERLVETAEDAPFTIVMFDIDGFKAYNDAYGHPAGDEALCMLAGVLRAATEEEGLAARYGGEEFLAVLPRTEAEKVLSYVYRVRRELSAARGARSDLTVCAGLAEFRGGMSYSDLLEAVDQALYRAKREGPNRVHVFDPLAA